MPFRPYHRFANQAKLEALISDFGGSGAISPQAFSSFHRYNPAMIHKLKSAKYNFVALSEKLTSTDIQEAAIATSDFMFEVNMFIDGFFYNSGSALDILARIVLTMFAEPLTGNIYFQTAHTRLSQSRPGDPILSRLSTPSWRPAFSNYRNTLTHELILASKYQIEIDGTGVTPSKIIFPLPDDPRAEPQDRKFKKYPNVLDYVKIHLQRILSTANTVYGDIVTRAEANGTLPL